MNKLTLDLDALVVDSFHTSHLDSWEGTVLGAAENVSAGGATQCGGVETCGDGCQITAGGATKCGGIETCGDVCPITGGGATKCGGVETCGAGCKE
jgi:hypothetical protein